VAPKPEKGMKVVIKADREAIFGEEEVSVKKFFIPEGKKVTGTLTGNIIAGYCEVENTSIDGGRHWFPVDQLYTEKGEQLEEEEIPVNIEDESP